MSPPPLPPHKGYIAAVRDSSKAVRAKSGIAIPAHAIRRLLLSPAFTSSFPRLRLSHGMSLPLAFPSPLAELNLLATLSLLNFASAYRAPLHAATGRGAFDNVRALVFAMYISSSVGAEPDLLSAHGMQAVQPGKLADLMGLAGKLHVENPHERIPGVVLGELGGPIWELVSLLAQVLNETGDVLVQGGYPDLGSFVLEALKEGERHRDPHDPNVECDVVLERLVRAIPSFQDMTMIDDQPVYCFKKALLLLHTVTARFHSSSPSSPSSPFSLAPRIPTPQSTRALPIFADNVVPSLLVHLGVLDLAASPLAPLFPGAASPDRLASLLRAAPPPPPPPPPTADVQNDTRDAEAPPAVPKEGPHLTPAQAFTLRAAAIEACDLIVHTARSLSLSSSPPHPPHPGEERQEQEEEAQDLSWMKDLTPPELDAWVWAVAKDRWDYRALERFVLRGTTFF